MIQRAYLKLAQKSKPISAKDGDHHKEPTKYKPIPFAKQPSLNKITQPLFHGLPPCRGLSSLVGVKPLIVRSRKLCDNARHKAEVYRSACAIQNKPEHSLCAVETTRYRTRLSRKASSAAIWLSALFDPVKRDFNLRTLFVNYPSFKGCTECTPERTRTSDAWFRKPSLYPAELRGQKAANIEFTASAPRKQAKDSAFVKRQALFQSGSALPGLKMP